MNTLYTINEMLLTSSRFHCFCSNVYVQSCVLLFAVFCQFHCLKKGKRFRAPCEDRTHDLQISAIDYETDALPTALTRHL